MVEARVRPAACRVAILAGVRTGNVIDRLAGCVHAVVASGAGLCCPLEQPAAVAAAALYIFMAVSERKASLEVNGCIVRRRLRCRIRIADQKERAECDEEYRQGMPICAARIHASRCQSPTRPAKD